MEERTESLVPVKRLSDYSDLELVQRLKQSPYWDRMDPTVIELVLRLERRMSDDLG
jgi:hypothetical protein